MGIFSFEEDQSIGEVRRIDTARVWVRVTSPDRLRSARVGRLVATKGADANEWVIGIVEKVWRTPIEIEQLAVDDAEPEPDTALPIEENGVQLALIGTYRAKEGERTDVFTRALLALPSIDEPVYPIEEKALERFMAIVSREAQESSKTPLAIGTFTLDKKAVAYLDGNKLFQRHAALVGSTGAGKSWTVAALLEQAATLPSANVILFDLHGEYRSLPYARQLRIAGPADLASPGDEAVFLPYWLLNYEEMQAMFVDRSEFSAHNQAMVFHDAVRDCKRSKLHELGKEDVLASFTIDSPVPFDIQQVTGIIEEKNTERVPGARGEKNGPFFGEFSRFLVRLESRLTDRRYGFMYQLPEAWSTYEALHHLADMLLGHGQVKAGVNSGVKVINFSEVPYDVLPVIVSLVARLVFQIQFWAYGSEDNESRHPVLMVCDEAHLYLPRLRADANPLERRALENFERIAKEGRKHGVGLLIVSQRPADVSVTILSQCNNFLSLRLTNGEDQAVIRRLMPESLEGILEILPTLEVGEAVIVGDAVLLPTRVQLTPPQHKPLSSTIDFWSRWAKTVAECSLAEAVECLRRQCRTLEAGGEVQPD